jgi:hypothetical protein
MNLVGAFLSAGAVASAGYWWRNPEAVAVAALLVNSAMLATGVTLLARNAQVSLLSLGANLLRPTLAAAAMVAFLWSPALPGSGSPFLNLAADTVAGGLVYSLVLAFLWLVSGRPEGAESEAAMLLSGLRRRLRPS